MDTCRMVGVNPKRTKPKRTLQELKNAPVIVLQQPRREPIRRHLSNIVADTVLSSKSRTTTILPLHIARAPGFVFAHPGQEANVGVTHDTILKQWECVFTATKTNSRENNSCSPEIPRLCACARATAILITTSATQ